MADAERNLRVKIQYVTDAQGAQAAAQGNKAIETQARGSAQAIAGADERMKKLTATAGQLRAVGMAVGAIGGVMSGFLLSTAKSYVQQVGMSETASRKWLYSTKQLEDAQIRVGRVIAEQAAPYLEKLANLAQKTADFAEKHPEVVKGALSVAGGAAVFGAVASSAMSAVGTYTKLAGALGWGGGGLLKGAAAASAAGTAAGAGTTAAAAAGGGLSALGIGASVAGGLGLGLLGNDLLAKSKFGQGIGMQDTGKVLTVGAHALTKLFTGSDEKAQAAAVKMGHLTGAIEEAGDAASTTGNELDMTGEQMKIYISYVRSEQQAERQRTIQLTRMTRDYNLQITYENEDFNRNRMRSVRDFNLQVTFAERDFLRQRAIQARDYNIEMARSEEDYQRSRARAQEDFEYQMWDVMRSGDALSYLRATRDYNVSRNREAEDYQISITRRQEDYQRQLQDQATQFAIQRAQRWTEYQIQLADENQDFQIRRRRAQQQQQIKLADMAQDYQEERLRRRQALLDQMNDLFSGLTLERRLRSQFTAAMIADLRAAYQSAGVNLYQGARASGGYVSAGNWQLHDGEFVLSAGTAREAERMAGQKLTQERMVQNLTGGGARSVNVNVYGDMSQSAKASLKVEMESLFGGLLEKTYPAGIG